MEKFKDGDIVVSLKDQSTNYNENPINKCFINKALVAENSTTYSGQDIWFEYDGQGAYDSNNFRYATEEEINLFVKNDNKGFVLPDPEEKFPYITAEHVGRTFICRRKCGTTLKLEDEYILQDFISQEKINFRGFSEYWIFADNNRNKSLELKPQSVDIKKEIITSAKLSSFPTEGCCESTDKRLIKYLNDTRNKGSKELVLGSGHTGIGWSISSCWALVNVDKSGKPLQTFDQLIPFLPFTASKSNLEKAFIIQTTQKIEGNLDISIIEQAKKRYPIGTWFIPVHLAHHNDANSLKCLIDNHHFILITNQIKLSNGNKLKNGHTFVELLYKEGIWAEIYTDKESKKLVEEPIYHYAEYGDGDFAIFLTTDKGSNKGSGITSKFSGSYYGENNWSAKTNKRPALEFEIKWLDRCIEAKKYISKESLFTKYEIATYLGSKIHIDMQNGILPKSQSVEYKIGDYVETSSNNINSDDYQFGWITYIDLESKFPYRVAYNRSNDGIWCKIKCHAEEPLNNHVKGDSYRSNISPLSSPDDDMELKYHYTEPEPDIMVGDIVRTVPMLPDGCCKDVHPMEPQKVAGYWNENCDWVVTEYPDNSIPPISDRVFKDSLVNSKDFYHMGVDPYQKQFENLCLMDVKQPINKIDALTHQSPLVLLPVQKSKLIII